MKVLIVGSTGMVGSRVLKECLANKDIDKIYVLNRRDSEVKDKKVIEIVNPDFLKFNLKKLPKIDVCFYCVGVYQGSVPKDKFIEVTYEYIQAFVKSLKQKNINFCLLSAQWANPKSKFLFAKWKGKAEKIVESVNFRQIHFFRPGYIHPTDQPEKKSLFFYKLIYYLFPLINFIFPGHCIELKQLAKSIVYIGVNGSDKKIFENKDIKNLKF